MIGHKKNLVEEINIDSIRQIIHDMRTPLTGIYGLTELLLHEETAPEKREYLTDILCSVQALLDYCQCARKKRNNQTPLKLISTSMTQAFNLKDFIQGVVKLEAAAMRSKTLAFKLSYDKNLPDYITVDRYRLNIVLANLLDNAIKFTQPGGCIHLQIKKSKTEGMTFVVRDNGRGMSVSAHRHIQAFLEEKGACSLDGTGLGLNIVKQLIHSLKGKIDCVSQWRKGTTWSVWIPA